MSWRNGLGFEIKLKARFCGTRKNYWIPNEVGDGPKARASTKGRVQVADARNDPGALRAWGIVGRY